ncbi:MAG TPA: nuclear transport factor 2 family protein [Flavisolibacter sp.]|jgi:nuclear transport factor 2 (NTF2) superfamily protein
MTKESLLHKAYELFNERNIDELLALMTGNVSWPNGWEGGFVHGHQEVRNYWTRQWKEIDPVVIPESFTALDEDRVEVLVQQTVKDMEGKLLFEGVVKHLYTFTGDKISSMQIQPEQNAA